MERSQRRLPRAAGVPPCILPMPFTAREPVTLPPSLDPDRLPRHIAVIAAFSLNVAAQSYPARPIRILASEPGAQAGG